MDCLIDLVLQDNTKRWKEQEERETLIFRAIHQKVSAINQILSSQTDLNSAIKVLTLQVNSIENSFLLTEDKQSILVSPPTFSIQIKYSIPSSSP